MSHFKSIQTQIIRTSFAIKFRMNFGFKLYTNTSHKVGSALRGIH
jgi:hypothetical protein